MWIFWGFWVGFLLPTLRLDIISIWDENVALCAGWADRWPAGEPAWWWWGGVARPPTQHQQQQQPSTTAERWSQQPDVEREQDSKEREGLWEQHCHIIYLTPPPPLAQSFFSLSLHFKIAFLVSWSKIRKIGTVKLTGIIILAFVVCPPPLFLRKYLKFI